MTTTRGMTMAGTMDQKKFYTIRILKKS
jgi:hypothetical protein